MATVKELREHLERIRVEREKNLKFILEHYFEVVFIQSNKPWRAVIGNKKCRPVPIHRDFKPIGKEATYPKKNDWGWQLCWPNMSEEVLRQELVKLGFILTKDWISISVPPCVKGEEVTFAQEWARKINNNYERYCNQERKKAKTIYAKLITDLMSWPQESVKTCQTCTCFEQFEFVVEASSKCLGFIKKWLVRDGIEMNCESNKPQCVKVWRLPSNN